MNSEFCEKSTCALNEISSTDNLRGTGAPLSEAISSGSFWISYGRGMFHEFTAFSQRGSNDSGEKHVH